MTYRLFIDDIRNPIPSPWVIARSSAEANRLGWAAEIEAISDAIVNRISSAARYSNDQFYADLIHGRYTPADRLRRHRFSPSFIAATQDPGIKAKVNDFLCELSAIRDQSELTPLFDKYISLE